MAEGNHTLVVTSVNPFSDVAYQQKCFAQWKSLGYRVVSANVKSEREKLVEQGFEGSDVLEIPESDSGASLYGKPVPLVAPLLKRLQKDKSHQYYIITNADIFPVARSHTLSRFWESCNSGIALTREETHALGAHSYFQSTPYRGGLDAFFMTQGALKRVNHQLNKLPSSRRMAFGVPGWDYLMGAIMLSKNVGGAILDSGLLLHRSHRATYGNMSEFDHYIPDMKALNAITSDDASAAAQEFATRVHQHCEANEVLTRKAKSIFYTPVRANSTELSRDPVIREVMADLKHRFPREYGKYRRYTLQSLIRRGLDDEQLSFSMFVNVLADSPSKLYQFSQVLFAACMIQRIMEEAGKEQVMTTEYPRGNQHAAALRNVLATYGPDSPERRVHIAILFLSELMEFSIFNVRLYKYLMLSCANESERKLLGAINIQTQGGSKNAA